MTGPREPTAPVFEGFTEAQAIALVTGIIGQAHGGTQAGGS